MGLRSITRTKNKGVRPGSRPDAKAWVRAGLELLAENGVDGVIVEALARRLGVTKGGFYWAFKDRDALLEAMLAEWRTRATLALIARLEQERDPPVERLRRLLRIPIVGPHAESGAGLELSVRVWGRRDPRARAALDEVDQLRLHYLEHLLIACGISKAEAPARAILGYSYMRVAGSLISQQQSELMRQCEAVLIRP
jgi:AcrR family transcriptional regulator